MLVKNALPIRILSTQQVPNNFHSRYHARGRTYLYRFAVAKNGSNDTDRLKNQNFKAFIPVEELDRCLFLQYVILPTFTETNLLFHLFLLQKQYIRY